MGTAKNGGVGSRQLGAKGRQIGMFMTPSLSISIIE